MLSTAAVATLVTEGLNTSKETWNVPCHRNDGGPLSRRRNGVDEN